MGKFTNYAAMTAPRADDLLLAVDVHDTITFAAAGTSHVADGVSDIIAATSSRLFIYNQTKALWYRAQ